MGTAHLSPHGTRSRWNEIVTYKRQHIGLLEMPDGDLAQHREQENEEFVVEKLKSKYSFKDADEWIHNGRGVDEKVIAETRHGVELRVKYHPSGSKYYFLVVTSGEFCEENLAIQHLEGYNKTLRKILKDIYGEVRKKTGRWTSTPLEVEA